MPVITGANVQALRQGLDTFIDTLQAGIKSNVVNQALPMIGNALGDNAASGNTPALNYLLNVRTQIDNALQGFENNADNAANAISAALTTALNTYGLAVSVNLTPNSDGLTVNLDTVGNQPDGSFQYGTAFTQSLAANLGLPVLGLTTHTAGTASATVSYQVHLGVGVSLTDSDFFVDTSFSQREVAIGVHVVAPSFSGHGTMGSLAVGVVDNGSDVRAQFDVDITDNFAGANNNSHLTVTELLASTTPNDFIDAWVTSNVDLAVHLDGGLAGDQMGNLPSVDADLNFKWDIQKTLITDGKIGGLNGHPESITLDNVTVDLGTIFGTIKHAFDAIMPILKPLAAITDVLTADLAPLKFIPGWQLLFDKVGFTFHTTGPALGYSPDGKVTLVDLIASKNGVASVQHLLEAINLIQTVTKMASLVENVSIGSTDFRIGSFSFNDSDLMHKTLSDLVPAIVEAGDFYSDAVNALKSGDWSSDPQTNQADRAVFSALLDNPQFSLPILSNPTSLAGLLTGQVIDLAKFSIDASVGVSNVLFADVPVFANIVDLKLLGSLNLLMHLSAGYDSHGFQEFADGGFTDTSLFKDGLYLEDFDAQGNERPEVQFNAQLQLIAALDAGLFEVGGGGLINGQINFDLNDNLHDLDPLNQHPGRVYLDDLLSALASNPFSLFTISGNITAGLTAYAQLLNVEVWRINSPRVTLGSFTILDEQVPPGLGNLNDDTLDLNLGPRHAGRLHDTGDGNDNFNISMAGSRVGITSDGDQQGFSPVTLIRGDGGAGNDQILIDASVTIAAELHGGAADDQLQGGSGDDELYGDAGKDYIDGAVGDDTLDGGDGDDILIGGEGKDSISGGDGIDIASYFGSTEGVSINLALHTAHGGDAEGDVFDAIEIIEGTDHKDVLIGDDEDNAFIGDDDNDSLEGAGGADKLFGNDGNDTLDGGAGDDTMVGGLGDDTYYVDSLGDEIDENRVFEIAANADGGHDIIIASIDYSLSHGIDDDDDGIDLSNIEDLTLTGAARLGIGNTLANTITGTAFGDTLQGLAGGDHLIGNAGNDSLDGGLDADSLEGGANDDTLNGGAGADTLVGGGGNDVYIVDDGADVIVEAAISGFDTVRATASYTLATGVSIEVLRTGDDDGTSGIELKGNEIAQSIVGNGGSNILEGMGGADTLNGGLGTDTATYRSSAVAVSLDLSLTTQLGGDAEGDSYISIEIHEGSAYADTLTGAGTADHLRGIGGTDFISGLGGNDTLFGGAGNDTLIGGEGDDSMVGGAGDDIYFVDSQGDIVDEISDDAGGTDLVITGLNYSLAGRNGVDNLTIVGDADHATGNEFSNTITATAHADTIDGGEGADSLIGGDGDDTYIVDNMSDVILELLNEGNDTIKLKTQYLTGPHDNISDPVATYSLDTNWGQNIENVDVIDSTWRIDVTGNALDNRLTGGSRENTLRGGDGNDTLIAVGGHDTLYGEAGNDTSVFDTNSGEGNSFVGGAGDDTALIIGGLTNDVTGNNGIDLGAGGSDLLQIDYHLVSDDVRVGFYSWSTGFLETGFSDYYAYGDTGIWYGTHAKLAFSGVDRFDVTSGSGNDTISGGDGDDTFRAGAGNDWINSYRGHVVIDGGDGNDMWEGDLSWLTTGQSINLNDSSVTQTLTDGSTIVNIERLKLVGSQGNDVITLGTASAAYNNTISSGNGSDTVTIRGNATGETSGDNTVDMGGGGDDLLIADYHLATEKITFSPYSRSGGDNETGWKDYYAYGNTGTWFGTTNPRLSFSGVERFDVTTGSGNDTIHTGDGADTLRSGSGDDWLDSGRGKVLVDGGDGLDLWQADISWLTAGQTINLNDSSVLQTLTDGSTIVNIERLSLTASQGNDVITLGTASAAYNNTINSGAGSDTVTIRGGATGATSGDNSIDMGGGGDDLLIADYHFATETVNFGFYSRSGGDSETGWKDYYAYGNTGTRYGESSFRLSYSGVERFDVTTGSGNDTLSTGDGADTLRSGSGDDWLASGRGHAVIDGGDGNDMWEADIGWLTAGQTVNLNDSSVTQTLTDGSTIVNVERLTLTTGQGNDTITLGTASAGYNNTVNTNGGDDTVTIRGGATGEASGDNSIGMGLGGDDLLIADYHLATEKVNFGFYSRSGGDSETGWKDYYAYGNTGTRYGESSFRLSYSGVDRFDVSTGSGNDTISTGDGADTVSSGSGDDWISTNRGHVVIDGGAGTDMWEGDVAWLTANQTIDLTDSSITQTLSDGSTIVGIERLSLTTGSGNDTITLGAAAAAYDNTIVSGAGSDTITVRGGTTWETSGYNAIGMGGGDDDLLIADYHLATDNIGFGSYGSSSGDSINGYRDYNSYSDQGVMFAGHGRLGFSGVDRFNISTGSGTDTITTGDGADTISAGGGNDWLNSARGKAAIDGGAGIDTWQADLAWVSGNQTIDLTDTSVLQTLADGSTLVNIERLNLTLGSSNDTIIFGEASTPYDSTIYAGAGDDTVTVRGGATGDTTGYCIIDLGLGGNDLLIADYHAATENFSFGFYSSQGGDSVNGYKDYYNYYNATAVYDGNGRLAFAGVDRFNVTTGTGNDTITTGDGGDSIDGGAGNDSIWANAGDDSIDGGDGNDTIDAGDGADTVEGGDGDDSIAANAGADSVDGGAGNDTIYGGSGNDTIGGGDGDDRIDAGDGADSVDAGAGDDTIDGGSGDNTIVAGIGNDTVIVRSGSTGDTIGYSVVDLGADGDDLLIADFRAGTDDIGFGWDNWATGDSASGYKDYFTSSATALFAGNGRLSFAGVERFDVATGSGNDTISTGDGADTVRGGDGNDTVHANGGADSLDGGAGDDWIDSGAGDDTVTGGSGNDTIDGGTGDDTITGGAGDDSIDGGSGSNLIVYSGAWSDYSFVVETNGDVTVTDKWSYHDGVDHIHRGQTFQFSNGTGTTDQLINAGPTDITLSAIDVAENSADDTIIGTLTGIDPNGGLDLLTFSLLDSAGGRFAIADGKLVVADASKLDFELAWTHSINVRVTDAAGEHLDKSFTINVTDRSESVSPVSDTNGAADTVMENAVVGATVGITAHAEDQDGGQHGVTYSLEDSAGGRFSIDGGGVVHTTKKLDREVDGTSLTIVVKATSPDSSTSTQSFVIAIGNSGGVSVTGSSKADRFDSSHKLSSKLPTNEEDTIKGGGGNDTLYALGGNDSIDGGSGADHMYGGVGDDLYIVDNAGDIVDEKSSAGGIDTVKSSVTFSLADTKHALGTIENLTLTGSGKINATGNGSANTLIGNNANNVLKGGAGADHLDGAGGVDTADYSDKTAAVSVTLSGATEATVTVGVVAEDFIKNIENLIGGSGADNLTGDGGNNSLGGGVGADHLWGMGGNDALNGGDSNDVLFGGEGNDTLIGGAGKDTLDGGAGADHFVFNATLGSSNVDTIDNFSSVDDVIDLENGVMKGLGSSWKSSMFRANDTGTAKASGDRIIYETDTGKLFYDADGNKSHGAAAIQIAVITGHPTVAASDFHII